MTTIANTLPQRQKWRTAVLAALAFWLSGSLLLDLVIMPGMYTAGMMTEPGFAAAGYSIFWIFNRIELLCAAIALTGCLVLRSIQPSTQAKNQWIFPLALGLLAIALVDTYDLTPAMSALGLQLNWFDAGVNVPETMTRMHGSYWFLEFLKLGMGGILLERFYRHS